MDERDNKVRKGGTRVILFGSPGSGKGTQATLLADFLGVRKISLGDILRGEVKKNSSLGREVKSYMERGTLVPDELVSRVVEKSMVGVPESSNIPARGCPQ